MKELYKLVLSKEGREVTHDELTIEALLAIAEGLALSLGEIVYTVKELSKEVQTDELSDEDVAAIAKSFEIYMSQLIEAYVPELESEIEDFEKEGVALIGLSQTMREYLEEEDTEELSQEQKSQLN